MHPSHPFWSLDVPRFDGQLLLTPCPGTQQVSAPHALSQLQLAGARALITLVTADELAAQGLHRLGAESETRGMAWYHLPIRDDEAPDAQFEQAWRQLLPELISLLRDGKQVAIHCRGGSGRTGLVAAALLMALGQPQPEAMACVRAHRPRAFILASHRLWLDGWGARLAG